MATNPSVTQDASSMLSILKKDLEVSKRGVGLSLSKLAKNGFLEKVDDKYLYRIVKKGIDWYQVSSN